MLGEHVAERIHRVGVQRILGHQAAQFLFRIGQAAAAFVDVGHPHRQRLVVAKRLARLLEHPQRIVGALLIGVEIGEADDELAALGLPGHAVFEQLVGVGGLAAPSAAPARASRTMRG